MAARNPSAWQEFNDLGIVVPRSSILESTWDNLFEDQVQTLDAPQLLFSFLGDAADNSVNQFTGAFKNRYKLDTVTPVSSADCNVYAYSWASNATTAYTITVAFWPADLSGAGANRTYTLSLPAVADTAVPTWRTLSASAGAGHPVGDTQDQRAVWSMTIDSGAGTPYVAGLVVTSPQQ